MSENDWPYSDDYTCDEAVEFVAGIYFTETELEIGRETSEEDASEEASEVSPSFTEAENDNHAEEAADDALMFHVDNPKEITEFLERMAVFEASYYIELQCSSEDEDWADYKADCELARRLRKVGLTPSKELQKNIDNPPPRPINEPPDNVDYGAIKH